MRTARIAFVSLLFSLAACSPLKKSTQSEPACSEISGDFRLASVTYETSFHDPQKEEEIGGQPSNLKPSIDKRIHFKKMPNGQLFQQDALYTYIYDNKERMLEEDKPSADYYMKYTAACRMGVADIMIEGSDNICDQPCNGPEDTRRVDTYNTREIVRVISPNSFELIKSLSVFTVRGELASSEGYRAIYSR